MIQINLAPGAEARRPVARRGTSLSLPKLPALGADPRALAAGAGTLLLVLVLGFAVWRAGRTRAELEERIAAEVRDSTRSATTIELIQALRARQDTIQQKIGVIEEVDRRRYVWPHLLDEIGTAVPAFTWLTAINSAAETPVDSAAAAPPLSFTVQGNAGSTQALTRFMKNLEGSPFVRDVTLVTSEQAEEEGRAIHRFTLEARYETPDSSAVETVPIIVVE